MTDLDFDKFSELSHYIHKMKHEPTDEKEKYISNLIVRIIHKLFGDKYPTVGKAKQYYSSMTGHNKMIVAYIFSKIKNDDPKRDASNKFIYNIDGYTPETFVKKYNDGDIDIPEDFKTQLEAKPAETTTPEAKPVDVADVNVKIKDDEKLHEGKNIHKPMKLNKSDFFNREKRLPEMFKNYLGELRKGIKISRKWSPPKRQSIRDMLKSMRTDDEI